MVPSINALMSPICGIPFAGTFIPICRYINIRPVNYPKLIEIQSELKGVLELAGGSELSIEIRASEDVMRELTALVRVSDLDSKDNLVKRMEGISSESREVARGLQRLGTRVGTAIDRQVVSRMEI